MKYGSLERYYPCGVFCLTMTNSSEVLIWRSLDEDLMYYLKKEIDKYYKNLYNKNTRK